MPRPRMRRRVGQMPGVDYFKPRGVPLRQLQEVILTVDEYEALRLKDFDGLGQIEAAEKMGISQPTFTRLIAAARHKAAKAIINGYALRIEGGDFQKY